MLSRRFTIFAALSLLVCVICGILWARSFWYVDGVFRISEKRGIIAFYTNDGITYAMFTPDYVTNWSPGWHRPKRSMNLNVADRFITHSFMGFQFRLSDPAMHLKLIGIPFWFPTILSFIAPCIWYLRRERARRLRLGLCLSCCRDLQGCKEKCPDCGAPIPAQVVSIIVRPELSSQSD